MSRRKIVIITSVVGIGIFVAELIVPIVVNQLTKGATTEEQLTIFLLVGFLIAQVGSLIIIGVILRTLLEERNALLEERNEVRTGITNIMNSIDGERREILASIASEQSDLVSRIEEATRQYGLLVRFVEEIDGSTYELATEYIRKAEKSLFFLDYWTQTKDYYEGQSIAQEKRQAYYNAIVEQVEKHKNDSPSFHSRIIQIPGSYADFNHFKLKAGSIFMNYLKSCLIIKENSTRACIFRLARPRIHAQIIIIDEHLVIWPILSSTNLVEGSLRRHGAIFFEDGFGHFVQQIMKIYHEINNDERTQTLSLRHLGTHKLEDL